MATEPTMKTVTPTQARANLFRLLEETAQGSEPVLIVGKNARVVMVSEDDWNDIQETLYLLSVPGLVESIKEAQAESVEDMVPADEVPWSRPRHDRQPAKT